MISFLHKLRGFFTAADRLTRCCAILAVIGLGGVLLVTSGVIPIKASSRHLPVTEWFLHFAMRRSIDTHSLGTETPPLDDPALVLKGATHYEVGCRQCHGSPGLEAPRIAHRMTPLPPYLPPRLGEWKARELFYVVKHGVKFTGMPAWPARDRDDEIWAVVAFLQKFPDLDEGEYRRLVDGPPVTLTLPAIVQSCARCHERDSTAFPHLAGQHAEYLQTALEAYARSERHSGIMQPIAADLDAVTIRQLALHYASLTAARSTPRHAPDDAPIKRGREIAEHGIPARRVPSCVDCHGPGGKRHKPTYPALAGQPSDYLVLQLELFKSGHRGGSTHAHLMQAVAPRLQPEEMRDVALYFESLNSPGPATVGYFEPQAYRENDPR